MAGAIVETTPQEVGVGAAQVQEEVKRKTIPIKLPTTHKTELSSASIIQPGEEKKAEAEARPKEEATVTKRKTIRIKRPTTHRPDLISEREPSNMVVARPVKEEQPGKEPIAVVEAAKDEPGLIYVCTMIAAILIACVVVYMLTSQVFPNLHLVWPGKVLP